MTDNKLQKSFRKAVTQLEQDLFKLADGENIIKGTKDKPIVTDSQILPIEHFFMEGVYIRKMTMRKDSAVVGAIHKHLHMCFLTEGHVSVADEKGTKEYVAPCHIIATPGIKRVLYAHENSVWYNTHKNPTNTTNIDEIERETVSVDYKQYDEYIKNK